MSFGIATEQHKLRYLFLQDQPPSSLLEVGCGKGRFLHRMHKKGWSVSGIEIDRQALEYIKKKYQLKKIFQSLKEAHFPNESFDWIVLSHVIEHLLDPITELKEVFQTSKT
ncbi:hypothetical protein A946_02065 [Methylacidiphilum kamchatkense Kam1]|uniref:Methyltransferase family protein n=2 Tax=Methylacidiphilum kamchatkense TaxID=431057 RepID=A0A0C1RN75_9BACT|nr:class I SAM-dependent methyltransferase [Methylacidiphilum kamchatkense]KIE59477.1 hypothetical protein A946_02065 [Methylacidiphilum kamchatkense Kam1]QDQ42524.1 methyltransferase family protein [Methylacidiphilum kamchatkense Kam1]